MVELTCIKAPASMRATVSVSKSRAHSIVLPTNERILMRYRRPILLIAFLFVFPTASAQDEHADHHPQAEMPAGQDQELRGAASLEAGMERLEALMAEIRSSQDPAQRSRLLTEHLAALQNQMQLIRSQRGAKMAMMQGGDKQAAAGDDPHAGHGGSDGGSDAKKGGGMMGGKGGMMGMHKKMEGRVDMLERLIEQMIEREAAASPHAGH
jgi:hypothetical protein